MNRTIGIIAATDTEMETLLNSFNTIREERKGSFNFHISSIRNEQVIMTQCGIGKVAAACCCQSLIDYYNPDLIMNTGVAGGIGSADIGDAVVVSSFIQHDFDVSGLGYPRGYCFIGNEDSATFFPTDKRLSDSLESAALLLMESDKVHRGNAMTGDSFICDSRSIPEKWNILAADMEGGSIAQVCLLNRTPFISIKLISDNSDGGSPKNYEKFKREMASRASSISRLFLERS